jgi:DNA-binding CsgD family transcriptional regulator
MQREQRVAIIDIRRVDELSRGGRYLDAEKIILQETFQQTLNETHSAASIPLLQMQAAIALARFELLTRNVEAARTRLVRLVRQAQAHQNELVKLKSLLLLAAAQFLSAERAESMQSMRSFCSRIIPTGLKQLVIEERPLIQPVLEHLLEIEPMGTAAHANAEILAADWLNGPGETPNGSRPLSSVTATEWLAAPGILSPRQREVLELLAAGLSGKEIATQLSLAESTIKSYRKTLYAKLRAGRRSQALANARRMLLLSH